MIKFKPFFLACIIPLFSYNLLARTPFHQIRDSLILGISCHSKEISDENDLKFVLFIQNLKQGSILLTDKYDAIPGLGFDGNIGYQVVFCNENDTIDFTDKIVISFSGSSNYRKTHLVESRQKVLLQASVEPIYFWKKGDYMLRFYLRKKFFTGLISNDVYTQWIYIRVLAEIWKPAAEGSTPIMRQ